MTKQTKQKSKLNQALKESLDSAGLAWEALDDIEASRSKRRPYGSPEERMESGETKDLLKELKSLLDRFS